MMMENDGGGGGDDGDGDDGHDCDGDCDYDDYENDSWNARMNLHDEEDLHYVHGIRDQLRAFLLSMYADLHDEDEDNHENSVQPLHS